MDDSLRWTRHGRARQDERGMSEDNILAALAGRVLTDRARRVTFCCDPATRTVVVVRNGAIVTVFHARPRQIKHSFGLWEREKGE